MIINIYSDIHGRYNTYVKLKKIMPKFDKEVFVGDLINRGKNSVEMIDYIIKNKSSFVIGNHEILYMTYRNIKNKYIPNISDSYYTKGKDIYENGKFGFIEEINKKISPKNKDKWLKKLDKIFTYAPIELVYDNIRITHSPPSVLLNKNSKDKDIINYFFYRPKPILVVKNKLSIFGHSGEWSYFKNVNDKISHIDNNIDKISSPLKINDYICIDNMKNYLTGISIDTVSLKFKIFYVDGKNEWIK